MIKKQDLLAKIVARDQKFIEELFVKNREPFVKWISIQYNIGEVDANEVYQESFLIFYENVIAFRLTELTSSIKTYLFGIGKNKVLAMKREKKEEPIQENMYVNHLDENPQNKEEMFLSMERGLNDLGNPCKKLLELFYIRRMTMEEICSLMSYKNSDSVKNQKYKCLQRLKKLVA